MEITLLKRQNVVAFRMPANVISTNYKLNDWKDMIWEGEIHVIVINKNQPN